MLDSKFCEILNCFRILLIWQPGMGHFKNLILNKKFNIIRDIKKIYLTSNFALGHYSEIYSSTSSITLKKKFLI